MTEINRTILAKAVLRSGMDILWWTPRMVRKVLDYKLHPTGPFDIVLMDIQYDFPFNNSRNYLKFS